ncbi:MAG: penicillin-binding protein 2 [Acidobacteriota bacterium]
MRAYRDDQKFLNFRINLVIWGIVIAFFFLAGAFWWVQGVQAERYRGLADANFLREIPITAKRGLILDRNGKILADNQPTYSLMLRRRDLRDLAKTDPSIEARLMQFVGGTLQIPIEELQARIEKQKSVPSIRPIPLAEDLTVAQVSEIEGHRITFPVLSVEAVQRRNYRYGIMASHVIGYIGEANEGDIKKNPDLKPGDLIGKKGVELVYDSYLRGRDGARYMVVDSHGKEISEYLPARREPVPGQNVYLTIDFDLQRRAEQYFIEKEFVGSAVVLDPRNGEVMAMVSSPAFNPNVYSRRFTPEVWEQIVSNPFKIEVNRAIQGLYSPGSVFKAVMAIAGLADGAITPSTNFYCGGSDVFFGRRFRCWRPQGHGSISVENALKVSCDVFFYNTGARLGVDKIAQYAHRLTFGELSHIDLENERAGTVPSTAWASEKQHRKWYPSETISVAIGQGPLTVTPLQVANMMSSIANGGKVFRPHVLKLVEGHDSSDQVHWLKVEPTVIHELKLPAGPLKAVRQGLWDVVNEQGGTGGNARVEGLDICGKTGTVQVIAQSGSKDTLFLPFKFRDHAWFASFAPRDDAQLVTVVFIEHSGLHGGTDAAPLAREIYQAHFQKRLGTETINLTDPATLEKLKEGDLPTPGADLPRPPPQLGAGH